ncbi:TonB-dependent receptor domain-containing protein [Polaribacter litorisediminis]|uniref:TonB-dependent receptor domain-containing protein n=1 Tax=Polaribacter litorisediminis TaxID=1908341 RepID=UPI001CBB8609|nr:outer membrane beta-barrel family protein [Polaribacter litorisediminis]
MKKVLIMIAFLFSGIITAQTITGKVTDKTEVIPFANVILKDNNQKIIAGTTTNDAGTFELKIPKGTYTLEISFLGYKNFKNEINVASNLDLGTILLEENAQALDEVLIKTEKSVIERKIDRLVFNVDKSIAAVGGNGVDVLRVTPGIQLQNNQLSILGRGATQVMINGRLSPLAGDDLVAFLSGLSASDIVKIEVITNPPAKYDASGNGGLINIILKKGVQNSWKNATTISYNQNKYNFTTLNNNFFYNKNKVSFSASVNVSLGDYENLEGLEIAYPTNIWDIDIDGKQQNDQLSGRFLFDYAVSDNTSFGVQYLGNNTKPGLEATTTSTIFDTNNNLERTLKNNALNDVDNNNRSVNFHIISKLDSLGKQVSFDADYFTFTSNRNLDFNTEQFDILGNSQGISSSALNISNQKIDNFSSQLDMNLPFEKVNLSYGIKASFTNTDSGVLFFDTFFGSPILDQNQSTDFKYKENVLATYFSGNTKLNDKLTMQFGLRFEDTKTTGISADMNQENINNYSKFFPTLFLSYAKNENNNFNFSYGKRINRPNFRDLNPFRFYINDNSYSVGNPFLQPSFSDNFEISHLYKNNWGTSFSLNITTDGFGVFFNTDVVNQDQIVTRENYFKQYTYQLQESFSYSPFSWWKIQNDARLLVYITELTKNIDAEINNGVQFYAESNNTFSLTENTKLQANAWYSSFHNDGLFSLGQMFHLSFGLQHSFKNNIKLSMLFSDVLDTGSLRDYNSTVSGIDQSYFQNASSRNFRVSLSYDFGNKKVNVKNRRFSNDDEQRRSN